MSVLRFAHRRWTILALATVLACGGRVERASPALRDDFGDSIVVGPVPVRIVSLSPATTEILFALGVGGRLVGRTHWDTYPESASAVPDLGNGIRPNVEAILAVRPDLVVLYASEDNRDAARALRAGRVPVVAIRVDHVADFGRTTALLGRLIGEEARASLVVDSVTRTLQRVRSMTAARPRPAVFIPAWEHPLLAIGAGSFLSELIDVAGGRNVFGDLAAPSPQISFEELLRRDPDVIMTGATTAVELRADPAWRSLRAMRDGRLLVMDTTLIARPGVRLGEAAVSLARLLHPESFR